MSETSYGIGHDAAPHTSACAACRYQRRKCVPSCPLAPFFPYDSLGTFLNAHRLFGVNRILKILKNLSPDQKTDAVISLIYEANTRAADPVGGSFSVIRRLRRQIEDCRRELDYVMYQLAACRAIADPSSFHPSEYGLNLQDSFPALLSSQCNYPAFDEKCSEKECALMRLAQHPPPISQHGGCMDLIAKGQGRHSDIK